MHKEHKILTQTLPWVTVQVMGPATPSQLPAPQHCCAAYASLFRCSWN